MDDTGSKRSTLKEGKGNVVVSVRVRPNDGTEAKTDGEWMVDGRRSLIAYNGKEGGDYYYGQSHFPRRNAHLAYEEQITYSHRTMETRSSMRYQQSAW